MNAWVLVAAVAVASCAALVVNRWWLRRRRARFVARLAAHYRGTRIGLATTGEQPMPAAGRITVVELVARIKAEGLPVRPGEGNTSSDAGPTVILPALRPEWK